VRYDVHQAEEGLEYPLRFSEAELEEARSCHRSIREGYRDWLTIRGSDYFVSLIEARLKRLIPERTRLIEWVFQETRHEVLPEACRRQGLMRSEDEDAVRRYPCPCCGFVTLEEEAGYDICPVCFWEDDGQSEADADEVRGGPNGALSLTEARQNFMRIGAVSERHRWYVRPPWPAEFPKRGKLK
jgi:hypothetical protein